MTSFDQHDMALSDTSPKVARNSNIKSLTILSSLQFWMAVMRDEVILVFSLRWPCCWATSPLICWCQLLTVLRPVKRPSHLFFGASEAKGSHNELPSWLTSFSRKRDRRRKNGGKKTPEEFKQILTQILVAGHLLLRHQKLSQVRRQRAAAQILQSLQGGTAGGGGEAGGTGRGPHGLGLVGWLVGWGWFDLVWLR